VIDTIIFNLPLLFLLLSTTMCGWMIVRRLRYQTWLGALVGGVLIPVGEIFLPVIWFGRSTMKVAVCRRPSGEVILLEWSFHTTMKRRFQILMLRPAEGRLYRAYLSSLAHALDLPPGETVSLVLYNSGYGRLRMQLHAVALMELVAMLDRALARCESTQSEVAP